jgi:hypothetical protein
MGCLQYCSTKACNHADFVRYMTDELQYFQRLWATTADRLRLGLRIRFQVFITLSTSERPRRSVENLPILQHYYEDLVL